MKKTLAVSILAISSALLGGCGFGKGPQGDLVGAEDRLIFNPQEVPFGMVPCPGGTFHMGQTDQDISASMVNMNKQVTIAGFYMDETEITNNEYRQFIDAIKQDSLGQSVDVDQEFFDNTLHPDTTVWMTDFTYHMGDPLMEYYYSHPAFDDYPVVGVNWFAARYFCEWRTKFRNAAREEVGYAADPNFRLPSEAEWEYAARGGRDLATYPWGGPYLRNSKGCMLANFKPGRGDYVSDGFAYTSEVGSFFPNDFGLYDMAGNVAEWCDDAYMEASVPLVWDLNPTNSNNPEADKEPRKVVRGGSWKDIAYYLETGTRSYEDEKSAHSYVGFRCSMIQIGMGSNSSLN